MTDMEWRQILRLLVTMLAVAPASIPAALDRARVVEP